MAIEIVDFPIKMVIFHCYVSSPEGKFLRHFDFILCVWCVCVCGSDLGCFVIYPLAAFGGIIDPRLEDWDSTALNLSCHSSTIVVALEVEAKGEWEQALCIPRTCQKRAFQREKF